ncbi:MAG: imidazole glycerol phosphate synthase subunit HisH [Candidatus Omnitrophota bacterium]|jgi:glutamine amidotransferase
MKQKIVVVDYGMGNLRSVSKALEASGARVIISDRPSEILKADKLVFPGVGAFKDAVSELRSRRIAGPIREFIDGGRPFLGLCLGLQLLLDKSEEAGSCKGLGIIEGKVLKFRSKELKIPHMGWNQLSGIRGGCPLFKGVPEGSYVYFVHSYYALPEDKRTISAYTDYGVKFASAIWSGNVYATQFHPEKSQALGLKIMRNFVKI